MPKNNSDTKQMTRPPAQILRLLFLTLLEAFHPAGAAWVALLAGGGYGSHTYTERVGGVPCSDDELSVLHVGPTPGVLSATC